MILKIVVAMQGILPKGMTKIRKRVMEDNVANITRSGSHYNHPFLEKDHSDRPRMY